MVATYYYHYDALGSTERLTDASQNTTDTYTYTAFGDGVGGKNSTKNSYGWLGRVGYQFDGFGVLSAVRARWYKYDTGRWIGQDPLTSDSNDYRYCINNPILGRDPSGLSSSYDPWAENCKIQCYYDCNAQYPHWWQYHLYVGCVNGCNVGCKGQPFNICTYIDSWPDCYKDALQCACGFVSLADIPPIPYFSQFAGGLDCACQAIASIQALCAQNGGMLGQNSNFPQVLNILGAAAWDCSLDILGSLLGGRGVLSNWMNTSLEIALLLGEEGSTGILTGTTFPQACCKAQASCNAR